MKDRSRSGSRSGSIPLTEDADPDTGGPKTYGSDGSGFGSGSATLSLSLSAFSNGDLLDFPAGWSGEQCQSRECDPRCALHGQCKNWYMFFFLQVGRGSSARAGSVTRAARSTGSARTGPACACAAGTADTARWRAVRHSVQHMENAGACLSET